MPPHNFLQHLQRLSRSSPEFHGQLSNAFRGEEYRQRVLNIQGDNLASLVDSLDKVRRHVDPFRLC